MRKPSTLVLLVAAACLATGPSTAAPPDTTRPVTVFAAASTQEALEDAARAFETRTGRPVRLSFGASSTLARQIDAGAEAEVFVSADAAWMDYLAEHGRLEQASRVDLAGNTLVLAVPPDWPGPLVLTPGAGGVPALPNRIAVGDPAHVPAGMYAREALEHLGWWGALEDRLLPCSDVRAALRLLLVGEADGAIVYATDLRGAPRARVAFTFPEDSHSPITYPAALCVDASPGARAFLGYLASDEGRGVFLAHGFSAPPRGDSRGSWLAPLSSADWSALRLSLQVAICAVAVLLVPGIACAWLLARARFPGKTLVEVLVHLPLVLPPVVTGYALLLLLGREGAVGHWLDATLGVRVAFTWGAAVIASMVMAFPLMVRPVRLAIESIDPDLDEASRTLGAGPCQSFFQVTLPLATPGILSGMVLSFARSLGEFGATIVFAGSIPGQTQTLPLAVFTYLQRPGGEAATLRLAAMAGLLSFGALLASQVAADMLQRSLGVRPAAGRAPSSTPGVGPPEGAAHNLTETIGEPWPGASLDARPPSAAGPRTNR